MKVSVLETPPVTRLPVQLEGGWSEDHRWRWRGRVAATEATAVLLLCRYADGSLAWAKSIPKAAPEIELGFLPLDRGSIGVQVVYWAQPGGFIQGLSTVLRESDYRPAIRSVLDLTCGRYVRLANLKSYPAQELGFIMYAKRDLTVRRNHVWGVKDTLLAGASPLAQSVLRQGRFGVVPSTGA
jgi:hypothetical protein